MSRQIRRFAIILLVAAGCTKEIPDQPHVNVPPKTYLWLFPDSTIAQGASRQHLHWWGEDPDGTVRGYLFAAGKFFTPSGGLPSPDTIEYRWRTANDTVIAFPLVTRQDTFSVVVRAVDNTFTAAISDTAFIRMGPGGAFWDKNGDGIFNGTDLRLPDLGGAVDRGSARLGMPLLNQPPSIAYAPNPNDPTVTMQQPETTFTVATFAWAGSDPDGDQTVASYDLVLNDTADASRSFTVPANVRLVTLVAPRSRTDGLSGVADVDADVYGGTYGTSRRLLGTLPHLRLDTLNTFYVRARDVAGDVSGFAPLPDPRVIPVHRWFVKRPVGRALIVDDYISADRDAALAFHRDALSQAGYPGAEVIDIGRGLTPEDKRGNKPGVMVPPFVDPALITTLHLFDVVLWYTDPFPSLGVAQFPLFQYVRDGSHHGKVIYATMFETSNDPRGALTDFAPLDSVSSVDLSTGNPLLPRPGDTRIQQSVFVQPDSSNPGEIYPGLQFNVSTPGRSYSLFMRPLYKRADAAYIYHIQRDLAPTPRYVYTPTLRNLNAVAAQGTSLWACGDGGVILGSADNGASWQVEMNNAQNNLLAMTFTSPTDGWVSGTGGTLYQTTDGGGTWANRSVVIKQDIFGVAFPSPSIGIAVGTSGLLIRSTDGGANWSAPAFRPNRTLRAVAFSGASRGIAVGDSGLAVYTGDAGATWQQAVPVTGRQLNAVSFLDASTAIAVGAAGTILRSTDAGATWAPAGSPGFDLRGVSASGALDAWTAGAAGTIRHSTDGGLTWLAPAAATGIGQTFNAVAASSSSAVTAAATGGVIAATSTAGAAWTTVPALPINVGVVDGPGADGKRSFVFLGLPLHLLNGPGGAGGTVVPFLNYVIHGEFGL